MPFSKGQSGNPNGRPPKPRALAKILETAGKKTVLRGGKKISRKNILAEMLWSIATEGKVTIPDDTPEGSVIAVKDMAEWLAVARFIHVHIDGPAKAEVDLTSDNQPLVFNIMPASARPETQASEPDDDDN